MNPMSCQVKWLLRPAKWNFLSSQIGFGASGTGDLLRVQPALIYDDYVSPKETSASTEIETAQIHKSVCLFRLQNA